MDQKEKAIMSKGKKQMLVACVVLAVLIGCYCGAKQYSAKVDEKKQADAAANIVQITDFQIADVTAFSYTSADLEAAFVLDGEAWKYTADESLEIDTAKVESFLENFNAIESENVIEDTENAEEFGLEDPMSSITFEFADGETLTCTVGEYNDVLGVYYFATDAGEAVYTVSGTVANKLSNTVDNFVVEEEEEETAETSEENISETEEISETDEENPSETEE